MALVKFFEGSRGPFWYDDDILLPGESFGPDGPLTFPAGAKAKALIWGPNGELKTSNLNPDLALTYPQVLSVVALGC